MLAHTTAMLTHYCQRELLHEVLCWMMLMCVLWTCSDPCVSHIVSHGGWPCGGPSDANPISQFLTHPISHALNHPMSHPVH